MREWFERQLAAGLPALAGSQVSGTLAVAPALLNELIALWLARSGSVPSRPQSSAPQIELDRLRAAVKSLSVRVEPGRILFDVEIRL